MKRNAWMTAVMSLTFLGSSVLAEPPSPKSSATGAEATKAHAHPAPDADVDAHVYPAAAAPAPAESPRRTVGWSLLGAWLHGAGQATERSRHEQTRHAPGRFPAAAQRTSPWNVPGRGWDGSFYSGPEIPDCGAPPPPNPTQPIRFVQEYFYDAKASHKMRDDLSSFAPQRPYVFTVRTTWTYIWYTTYCTLYAGHGGEHNWKTEAGSTSNETTVVVWRKVGETMGGKSWPETPTRAEVDADAEAWATAAGWVSTRSATAQGRTGARSAGAAPANSSGSDARGRR